MQARRLRTPGDIKATSPTALAKARIVTTTDVDYLTRAADNTNALLRMCVIDNPLAPLPVVLQLARDPDLDVRAYVAWQRLTETHQAPLEIIETLAADDEPYIRLAVASYFHAPRHVLVRLAADDDVEVRRMIARRPDVPEDVVALLCEDRDYNVRYAAKYITRERTRQPQRRRRTGAGRQATNHH